MSALHGASASVKFAEPCHKRPSAFSTIGNIIAYPHDLANGAKTRCIAVQDLAGSCAKREESRM